MSEGFNEKVALECLDAGVWTIEHQRNLIREHAKLVSRLDSETQLVKKWVEAYRKQGEELDQTMRERDDARGAGREMERRALGAESRLGTALGLLGSIRNDAADLAREGSDARVNRILSCATHLDSVERLPHTYRSNGKNDGCAECGEPMGSHGGPTCPMCGWEHIKGFPCHPNPRVVEKQKILDDGFGNMWYMCKRDDCGLEIVRPGKVQCGRCSKAPIAV